MKYCTISETAKKWNVSKTLVRRYIQQNRIPKVVQKGALNMPIYEDVTSLVKQIRYQCSKNDHWNYTGQLLPQP